MYMSALFCRAASPCVVAMVTATAGKENGEFCVAG